MQPNFRSLFVLVALSLAAPLVLAAAPPPKSAESDNPEVQLPTENYEYLNSGIMQKNDRGPPGMPPVPPGQPAPSADPRNLEGSWGNNHQLVFRLVTDMHGFKLPYTEKAKSILNARNKATYVDGTPFANASAACLPPGQRWAYNLGAPFQIFQDKRTVVFLFQEYHQPWVVRMDQPHRPATERSYMGDSVGRWDGDTLVVDTTNFKMNTWIDPDGTPASKNAHWVYRIRKINRAGPELEIVATIDDPAMYTNPWSIVNSFGWRPERVPFGEYNCEPQVATPGGIASYGLIREPAWE